MGHDPNFKYGDKVKVLETGTMPRWAWGMTGKVVERIPEMINPTYGVILDQLPEKWPNQHHFWLTMREMEKVVSND